LTIAVADGLADYKKAINGVAIEERNHTASLCGVGGLVWHRNPVLCGVGALFAPCDKEQSLKREK